MWIYRKIISPVTGREYYSVGFFIPTSEICQGENRWEEESAWDSAAAAMRQVNYLNGGSGE